MLYVILEDNFYNAMFIFIVSFFAGSDRVMQIMTLRGIPESRLKKSTQKGLPAYQYSSIKDMLMYYLSCTTYASANHVTAVDKPLTIGKLYPKIFDDRIGVDGNIIVERSAGIGNVFIKF